MHIDLDQPMVAPANRSRWVWLSVLAVASVLIGGAVRPQSAASSRSLPGTREISFEVEGKGRADFAGVWTRTRVIRYVPSSSSARYNDPLTAVLTVRAEPNAQVTCRIRVDGVIAHEQVASSGQSATCVWVRDAAGLPVVTD